MSEVRTRRGTQSLHRPPSHTSRRTVAVVAVIAGLVSSIGGLGELVRVTSAPFVGGDSVVFTQSGWSAHSYLEGTASGLQRVGVPSIGLLAAGGASFLVVGGVAALADRWWRVGVLMVCTGTGLVAGAAVMAWTTVGALASHPSPPGARDVVVETGTGTWLLCASAMAVAAVWLVLLPSVLSTAARVPRVSRSS